jgi:transcriptional regulator with XRE-family HTH domain
MMLLSFDETPPTTMNANTRPRRIFNDLPPLAKRIRESRERAGLSQVQLAKMIDMSQSTVDGYEHGRQPKISMLQKIAAICKVPEDWLITGHDVVSHTQAPVISRPSEEQAQPAAVLPPDEETSRFAWTIDRVREFLTSENFAADPDYFIGYTQKLLRLVHGEPDDAKAKDAILRAIELDRQEWRRHMKIVKDRFL